MKAAPITNKPGFSLMTQADILLFYHIQIPRWMFFDSRYKEISLDAKMVYGFLLNRFQLSKLNGWVNADGEVFLIYTREDLSDELGISYRKVISCMKELQAVSLIWERRCGRGDANQIYLARVEVDESEALRHRSAPFVSPGDEAAGSRTAETAYLDDGDSACPEAPIPIQDLPESHIKNCENGISRTADSAGQELPFLQSSYIDNNNTDTSDTEKSQIVQTARARAEPRDVDGDATMEEIQMLDDIIERCELWVFPHETAKVFENAIERLWFSTSFRIGKAELPQKKVRSHLHELDNIKLQEAARKIGANTRRSIRDSTAYIMAVIFNTIWESESDVMVDPYLNSLRQDSDSGGGS